MIIFGSKSKNKNVVIHYIVLCSLHSISTRDTPLINHKNWFLFSIIYRCNEVSECHDYRCITDNDNALPCQEEAIL
jgi:hypothetical protein